MCPKPQQSPLPTLPPGVKAVPCHQPPWAEGPCPHRGPRLTPPQSDTSSHPPPDPQAPALSPWEAPGPFRHPSPLSVGAASQGQPVTVTLAPLRLRSLLQPGPGLCPFRDNRVSTASHVPAVTPPQNQKKGPSTGHWGHGAIQEGSPDHSHPHRPRLALKTPGKLCSPLPSAGTREHRQGSGSCPAETCCL